MRNTGQRFVELQLGANDEDRVSVGLAAVNTSQESVLGLLRFAAA